LCVECAGGQDTLLVSSRRQCCRGGCPPIKVEGDGAEGGAGDVSGKTQDHLATHVEAAAEGGVGNLWWGLALREACRTGPQGGGPLTARYPHLPPPDESVCVSLCCLNSPSAPNVGQEWPEGPTAGDGEQPELPLAGLSPQKPQHRHRVGAFEPFRLG